MASMPEPVGSGSPQYAPGIQIALSLKGQPVQTYNFDQSEILVGRDPYCHVYVDNPGVSRQHFKIDRGETGEYRVTDLGSSNGTYLNDRPVQVAPLRDRDVIQFSKYTLQVGLEEMVGSGSGPTLAQRRAGEGATVMLSPSEVRSMMAESKAATPPRLNVVQGGPAATPRASAPASPPAPSQSPAWGVWIAITLVALGIVAVLMWRLTQQ